MRLEELNGELQRLVGEKVHFVRIAGNSAIVYFFGEPGTREVVSVFINPTWRLEKSGAVVIGSYDFQIEESDFDSKEDFVNEWDQRTGLFHALDGKTLEWVSVDAGALDLCMRFEGLTLRNFANSAFEDHAWTYRNRQRGLTADVSPLGIALRT